MQVVRRIGRGGFGNVDHVILKDGTECARKEFSQNQPLTPELLENVKKRFRKEVNVQSAIDHPNIVRINSSDLAADPPYYLMPLAECSLQDELSEDRSLGGNFVSAISDIVAALDELHSMEIFHRDLKPQNVLAFRKDGMRCYAVSDFGLISMKETNLSELTSTGMGKGSDFYTAPEIATDLRNASAQSDIYSLGCILHEMVGDGPRVPFREIREGGEFGAILSGCTKDDPKNRFASARAVLDAILSVEFEAADELSVESDDFVAMLAAKEPPEPEVWARLADHLEVTASRSDIGAICGKLTVDRIKVMISTDRESAKRIAMIFAEWVAKTQFNFELCDAIANRVEVLFDEGDLELKAECLMALLEMGTGHNRWYVERKFMQKCGADMDENLAKRLVVRLHILGAERVCRSIRHLERSINVSREELHPRVVLALSRLC